MGFGGGRGGGVSDGVGYFGFRFSGFEFGGFGGERFGEFRGEVELYFFGFFGFEGFGERGVVFFGGGFRSGLGGIGEREVRHSGVGQGLVFLVDDHEFREVFGGEVDVESVEES